MTKPHPHADILRAIADGKKIEYQSAETDKWCAAELIDLVRYQGLEFRSAPETIVINGVECPKSEAFNSVDANYVITVEFKSDGTSFHAWYPTEEAARTVYESLCKPFKS